MGKRKKNRKRGRRPVFGRIDTIAFCLFLTLVGVGLMMIFSVNYEDFRQDGWGGFLGTAAGKQAMWIGICGLIFGAIMILDSKLWQTFAYPIYAFSLLLLVLVLFLGTNIKGATSWFSFGGFSVQPSELAKFGTCLAVSAYLSTYSTDLKQIKAQLLTVVLLLAPMLLILLQPDAGSALVFLSFLAVMYRAGLSPSYYILGGAFALLLGLGLIYDPWILSLALLMLVLAFLVYNVDTRRRTYLALGTLATLVLAYFLVREGLWKYVAGGALLAFFLLAAVHWQQRKIRLAALAGFFFSMGSGVVFAASYAFNEVLQPHQQDRINMWLKPNGCDRRGSLYNLIQSKTAIGSGGLSGKGFLNGTMTKLNYVPEQSTDFIFCTIGEEQGFIGSLCFIILFLLLLMRITVLAERQRTDFAMYYAYCVAGILFLHFFINIGMTMGLAPIIGIPLPFISKGGSSLMGFTIMMAVLLKLDKHR